MVFVPYQHVEKVKSVECEGLLDGTVYAFYKIDGTNGSVWLDERGIGYGSRSRDLRDGADNAGFKTALETQGKYANFFFDHGNLRLYGEWLVPHSLKTYRDNAWRDFYVFDVFDDDAGKYVHYEVYRDILEEYGINYIPPIAILVNPTNEMLLDTLAKCGTFLTKDDDAVGEGVVFKRYDFKNRHGRTTWGKMITNEFKEKHHKEMGAPILNSTLLIEQKIVEGFVTPEFIGKEQAKITATEGEWSNKCIPKLMGVVFYELIREETWNFLKLHKNPTIDFKLLQKLTLQRVRDFLDL